MTAKEITWLLATRWNSPFRARANQVVVPNVSWGFDLAWEADLLAVSKSGYLSEIEIKISMSDWKADFIKPKHGKPAPHIKRFFYACPPKLAERHTELLLPEGAGVIAVDDHGIRTLKPAIHRKGARRLREDEILKLMRLAALKAWDWAHKAEPKGSDEDVL